MNNSTISRKILLAAVFSTGIFILLTSWIHFPYLVDEFYYLHRFVRDSDFGIKTFDAFIALRPIFAVLNAWAFQTGLFEHPRILIWIYFFFHSIAFSGLLLWLIRIFKSDSQWMPKGNFAFVTASSLFAIFPAHHEMFFMLLNLPYTFGMLTIVVALFTRNFVIQSFCFFAAIACLETYLPASFFLVLTPVFFEFIKDWKISKIIKPSLFKVLPVIMGYILFRAMGLILDHWFKLPPRPWGEFLNWKLPLEHASELTKFLWYVHFYKTNYVSTVLQWLGIGIACVVLIKNKWIQSKHLLVLAVLPWLSGIHYLVVPYYAPRAIYAASEIRCALAALFIFLFLEIQKDNLRKLQKITIALIFIAFAIQYGLIGKIKNSNKAVLQEKIESIQKLAEACPTECEITIPDPRQGLKKDWMMVPVFFEDFAQWAALSKHPNKKIKFHFLPEEGNPSGQ